MAIPKKSANPNKGGKKLVKAKKAATIIVKTKTDKSLFQNKVKKANTLLSQASLLKKQTAATG